MSRRFVILFAIKAVIVLTPLQATACRGPDFHHFVLLGEVFPAVQSSPFIAKVVVLGIKRTWIPEFRYENIIADARVIEAVKGSGSGQIIHIQANPSSCLGGLDETDVGRQGFVAGRIENDVFFSGNWNNAKLRETQ